MSVDYDKLRMDARNRYSRTADDGSRVTLSLEGDNLVVQTPLRLDYLVTDAARRDAKTFSGKFQGIEVRFNQTEYLDSSGLGLLLALRALLPEGAKRPRLTGIRSEGVRLPLHHSKLDLLFDIQ